MTGRPPLAAIVLAAGKGTRMRSPVPKVLHTIASRPMLAHVLDALAPLAPEREVVVLAPGMEEVAQIVAPRTVAIQDPPLGTGHAVLAAGAALDNFRGDVLILYGDTPLITTATLERLCAALHEPAEAAAAILTFRPANPAEYGRVILDGEDVAAVVEYRDANERTRALPLCNGGMMAVCGDRLRSLLDRIDNRNSKGEYYLTDLVALARAAGLKVAHALAAPEEVLGINSQSELAAAEAAMQSRLRRRWLDAGVTMVAPETVWLSADTVLAPGVAIEPNVVFGPGVTVMEGAQIRAFSHLAGATVGRRAVVGPFARLRPGTRLASNVHIGNFVEVKNSELASGAKANHLTYLGDSSVGAEANIGAGTITCNYDGIEKARTEIGAGAFIGSNTALVAPVKVGAGAMVGAGSVITREVSADALAVARGRQEERPGWAKAFRIRKRARQQQRKD